MWRINIDPPADTGPVTFGGSGEERWWEQTDLTKLILAGNLLSSLSEDIQFLSALSVLDVCLSLSLSLSCDLNRHSFITIGPRQPDRKATGLFRKTTAFEPTHSKVK